jgi:chromosome segregation ATPase
MAGIAQILSARNARHKIKVEAQKAPADIEAVLLGGASQAVTLLTNSLEWAENELKDLRTDQVRDKKKLRELQETVTAKDVRINELESELLGLRDRFAKVQEQLDHALDQVRQLRENGNNGAGHTPIQ